MPKKRGHGEGTIYQRKDGTWAAQVTIGVNPETGNPKRATYYGRTRKVVQAKLDKARREQQTGTFVEPHKTTLGEWLSRWMASYQKSNVSPTTFALREMLVRLHIKPALGNILLTKLKPSDLQDLYTNMLESGRTDSKAWMAQVINQDTEGKHNQITIYGKSQDEVKEKIRKTLGDQQPEEDVEPQRRGLSAQTVRHVHNILNPALKQAMLEGLVNRNVAQAASPPTLVRQQEMKPLTKDEVIVFLTEIKNERLFAAFILDLATGLRRGELLGLKWDDVDLEKGSIQVKRSLSRVKMDGTSSLMFLDPKTPKSRRLIPIPEEVTLELRAHKARQEQEKLRLGEAYDDSNLVFATVIGKPIEPRNFYRLYTNLMRKAGLKHTRFHDCRHTFATLLLEMGEHPKVVQEILGHSKISQTLDTYSHIVPGMKERAAEKLNDLFKTLPNNQSNRS